MRQTEADFKRQQELVQRQAVSQATLDNSTSARDNAQANLLQAQVNTKIAAVNYGYTNVTAPFDGVVSAHLVSVGELVGASSPTQLATIVALDPIYVNFNVNEQDVLRIRGGSPPARDDAGRSQAVAGRGRACRPRPAFRTRASSTMPPRRSTSRPARFRCAACCPIRTAPCCRDSSSASACPIDQVQNALFVPDVALGSDQAGRYVLVVNGENVVEQRKVRVGPLEGELRVIEEGLKADDRVITAGLLRAIPGQKVDPQLKKIEAQPASAK